MADPLTTIMSVAGGALFGQLFGKKDKPEAPPEQAAPETAPSGSPNSNKPKPSQSFVSAATAPSQQTRGTATLLGQ